MIRTVIFCLTILAGSAIAQEGGLGLAPDGTKRVALVIGNGSYERPEDRLPNPLNDATAIAGKLRSLNFEVIEAIDLDYGGMRKALRRFDRALSDADAGLFFYAGHGMEYRGQNYLFPTDTVLETEGDLSNGLIDVADVLHVMETSVPTRILFLDACRNNPFARRFRGTLGATRSIEVGKGLSGIDAAVGTFIAYATAPGELAEDGQGVHSPFSAAMLQHLDEPGLDVDQLMRKVRNTVLDDTDERQVPWNSSSLRSSFYLNLPASIAPSATTAPVAEVTEDRPEQVAALEQQGAERVQTPSPESEIQVLKETIARQNEARLTFDRKDLQRALTALDYNVGPADGLIGPRTRRAIQAWQTMKGFEPTGYLLEEQLAAILEALPPETEIAAIDPLRSNTAAPAAEPVSPTDPAALDELLDAIITPPRCDVCPKMVPVEGGRFQMGSSTGRRSESPAHDVFIADFAISAYEITVGQWAECVADRKACPAIEAHRWLRDDQPANNVSWYEARRFAEWLSRRDRHYAYRLPSEAEWEYAASRRGVWRGWGSGETIVREANAAGTIGRSVPVGSYQIDHSGVYDMFGNVAEWVADCWNGSYLGAPADGRAWLDGDCTYRVVRGGSFASQPSKLRVTARDRHLSKRLDTIGFRVVATERK